MTPQRTLVSLKEALQQPFAPETIQFLPKDIRQENGNYLCKALPYANKRIYEDRLNELVFGEWSTPYTEPYAQGNKLIIPATVVILGVAHTDYGEAYFTTTGKNGNTREDDNTATEAYSQAFRRACAKFFLGRYLYDLPKLTLPYDPQTRRIAVSKAEQIAWVEKLYQKQGMLPKVYAVPQPAAKEQETASVPAPVQQNSSTSPVAATTTSPVQQNSPTPSEVLQQTPAQPATTTIASTSQQHASSAKETKLPAQPTVYPHDTFLDWVAAQVARDPERIQGICTRYHIAGLANLSEQQRNELTRRLWQQATQHRALASTAVATPSV